MEEWCFDPLDCGTLAGVTPDQVWFLLPLVLLVLLGLVWASSVELA